MKTLKTKSRFGVHFWSLLLAVGMLLALANVAHAATEAEKQTAIDAGLAYLAGVQLGDGHWEYGDTGSDIGTTGAALLAFIEEGHTPTSATAYSANVANGLNYLLSYAQSYPISLQPAGDPDTLVNGIGVKFNDTAANNSRDIYATGLALMPIAAVGTPAAIVGAGPQTGRTYADVIQDTVDYLAYAQNEGGWPRGGWRYYANQGSSDNSTSQWPTVALLYAQSAGATVPAFVATELAIWVNYIQNPGDGGSYYDNNFVNWGSNVSRTGTLLVQQVFSGAGAGTAAAQNYLNNQWLTTANSTWNGNFGHPYGMWAAYKGLEVTIGLDADQSVISNLHADPGDVDNPNHGWNWWEDYCENLVNTQNLNGSWSGYSVWSPTLATAWYINILAATEIPPPFIEAPIDIKPQSCPNPLRVNFKGNGMLPVAILGSEDFDVLEIDVATITLEGVFPSRSNYANVSRPVEGEECECSSEGPDVFLDLTLKFNRQEILTALEAAYGDLTELPNRAELALTLVAMTYDGTPVEGTDCLTILNRGAVKRRRR